MKVRHQPFSLLHVILATITITTTDAINGKPNLRPDGTCPLATFLPFTRVNNPHTNYYNKSDFINPYYSHLASLAMAVRHFNSRDYSIIRRSNLEELNEDPFNADAGKLDFNMTEVMSSCTVQIPEDVMTVDTVNSHVEGVKYFLNKIYTKASDPNATLNGMPCAFVGLPTTEAALDVSTVAAGLDIPVVTSGSLDVSLSGKSSPLTTRTTTNYHTLGEAVVHWLRYQGRTDFIFHVHTSGDYGLQMKQVINNALREQPAFDPETGVERSVKNGGMNMKEVTVSGTFEGFEPNSGLGYAMQQIKLSGWRTVIFSMDSDRQKVAIPALAKYAAQFDLLRDDMVWVFNDNIDPDYLVTIAETNKNISKLVDGAAIVKVVDNFEYVLEKMKAHENNDGSSNDGGSRFLASWKQQDETLVNYTNSLWPETVGPNSGDYVQGDADYFQNYMPTSGAGFLYDAVWAVGLGACHLQKLESEKSAAGSGGGGKGGKQKQGGGGGGGKAGGGGGKAGGGGRQQANGGGRELSYLDVENEDEKSEPDISHRHLQKGKLKYINPLLDSMLSTTFEGSTGTLAWKEQRNSNRAAYRNRRRTTITFGVKNIRKLSQPDSDTGLMHSSHFTHILHGGSAAGSDGEWKAIMDDALFLYAGGETSAPVLLRNQPDRNYISSGIRAFGLSMMSLSFLFCLASLILVVIYRKSGTMKAGQPIFLGLLILGAATMTFAMLTQSFDENAGWSENQLSAACAATPWLVSVGYLLIYCALFSKLWRINRVMQFSKTKVEIKHVIGPFAVIIIAALAILTAWTIDDPFQWDRSVINEETGETAGKCSSGKSVEYMVPLAILMALSTMMTAVMAWKTKDINDKYSESKWIFYTIAMQIQMLIVGLPVVAILQDDSSTDASYLMRVMLIWTVAVSTVLLIFVPKAVVIFGAGNKRKDRSASPGGGTVRISGLTLQSPVTTSLSNPSTNIDSSYRSKGFAASIKASLKRSDNFADNSA